MAAAKIGRKLSAQATVAEKNERNELGRRKLLRGAVMFNRLFAVEAVALAVVAAAAAASGCTPTVMLPLR